MPSVAHIIRRRRSRKQRSQQQQRRSWLWNALVGGILVLLVVVPLGTVFGLAGWLYARAVQHMPSPADTVYLDPIIGSTDFYDRTGSTLLYSVADPLGDEREWVDIEQLPPYIVAATLRMEDPDFLQAGGFDPGRTLTQLWRYILGSRTRPDTSIAGRLADNALLPAARSSGLDDEVLHIALTAEVQRRFTARRVLEWYLNTAYYGNDAYGIDAAARVYFGKSALDLTLDEAALLSAIPLAPQFNPFDELTAAQQRKIDLLRLMLAHGDITQEDFDAVAFRVTEVQSELANAPQRAPYFALYARDQAEDILNRYLRLDGERLVSRGGLRIITTLDLELYEQTECIMQAHLAQLAGNSTSAVRTLSGNPCLGAAYLRDTFATDTSALPDDGRLVVLDVQRGEVLTIVGDALSYTRQPGTIIHPLVYLEGFRSGRYTPASMLLDIPQAFPGAAEGLIYTPSNPDNTYRGPINLRDAMVAGLRPPVVSVAEHVGLPDIIEVGHSVGLNSFAETSQYDLALVERGGAVSVLDVSYMYSLFATMGYMQGVDTDPVARSYRARNPVAILRIEDSEGHVLWEYDEERASLSRTNILGGELAYLVNDILSDSSRRQSMLGIGAEQLGVGRPAAVMSGLAGGSTEAWTVGYTPQLLVGVHLGREDERPLSVGVYGADSAGAVWQAVMNYANARYDLPPTSWERPEGIVEYAVCEKSGLIPPEDSPCPLRNEIFLEQVPPTQEDRYWTSIAVNSQTGLRATNDTPTHLVIEQVYFVPPASAEEWWVSNNLPLPPQAYDTMGVPDVLDSVQIFRPQDFSFVGGTVEVRGTLDVERLASYQLRYGEGIRPTEWFEIGEVQDSFREGEPLGNWDTTGLEGFYTLELSVRFIDGITDSASVQVTIDNTPPTMVLRTAPNNATQIRWPTQTDLTISADVSDNLALDRVEFYRNGALLAIDEEWPYSVTVEFTGTGFEIFSATAFDQVGNQTSEELEIEIIRG